MGHSTLLFIYSFFYLSGIGKFIALDFARRGARVILACRSEARGTAALQEIRDSSGNQNVHLRLVDTSSLESVRKFAARILEEEKDLHILVNNAGVSGGTAVYLSFSHICPYCDVSVHTNSSLFIPTGLPSKITPDGLEITFATNHIGPFLLTSLLLGQTFPLLMLLFQSQKDTSASNTHK